MIMFTPATRPLKRFSGVTIFPFVKSFTVIDSTEPVASLTVVVPYPITIISSSCSEDWINSTRRSKVSPIVTSFSEYPKYLKTKTSPDFTFGI